jgi:glycosyltransferase involved in cell wall biosynthesis
MYWFAKEILTLINKSLGEDVRLVIAGPNCEDFVNRLDGRNIQFLSRVEDLTTVYNRARVFVAPTRFSAGIPHKVHEASAHGLPVVATTLTGTQLGWTNGRELLLSDKPEDFAQACVRLYQDEQLWNRLRKTALDRVAIDCSRETFARTLAGIVS